MVYQHNRSLLHIPLLDISSIYWINVSLVGDVIFIKIPYEIVILIYGVISEWQKVIIYSADIDRFYLVLFMFFLSESFCVV